ncbi:hypothetical protein IW262DRAFT_1451379 [Armillaria fumosa]|nr:hypothetical protein IW262DRAFT_1451379 [Armillaria fumosa]
MTTRSKKRGAQLTEMTVDPQISSQPSSSGITITQGTSAGTAIAQQGTSSDTVITIDAQTSNMAAAHVTSPLTPAESLHSDSAALGNKVLTLIDMSELPGAFDSMESHRWRILEKALAVKCEWCTMNDNQAHVPVKLDPPSTMVDLKTIINNEMLIPIQEDDDAGSELGIAEFESNRAPSPEINDHAEQITDHGTTEPLVDEDQEIEVTNQPNPDDDDQDSRSSDSQLDGTILNNDQLAYDLAHNMNGPWTDPREDE